MRIWVDADACPVAIKQILYRAAERARIELTLVANRALQVPRSELITTRQVSGGLDVADRWIVEALEPGDLVVTADVPLAADVIAKGAVALSPRGRLFTEDNIGERLAMRNLLDDLRGAGETTGGPPALGSKDRQAFAGELDRLLTRASRSPGGGQADK